MTTKRIKAGGRTLGTPNKTGLERIQENKARLEKKLVQMNLKLLLQRALSGNVEAIESCLRLIADNEISVDTVNKPKHQRKTTVRARARA
jgi:hypothetical protein